MKNQFRILVLMLITSTIVYAQKTSEIEMDEKYTIYKENFTTNENTTFVLNLNNTKARVFQSPDDNVYIEYTKEFKNTKKKQIQTQLELIIVSGKKEGNKITYATKSKSDMHDKMYRFEELMINRSEKKKSLKDSTQKPFERKSLDSIFHEIKASDSLFKNKLFGTLKIKPHVKKWKTSDQIIITKMVIKIPENIHVRATLENSNLVFIDDFYNRATMNVRNTKLKFKTLGNPLSILDVDNGYFNAKDITSGSYSFANVRQVKIGKLKNAFLNSEFTKVEIGEIGRGNKIIDFNSEYFFYNWTEDFQRFDLFAEYSKIHLFYPILDHSLKVVGNNTKSFLSNDTEIDMQTTSKGEKSIMMLGEPEGKGQFSGAIYMDIVNGIIYNNDFNLTFVKGDKPSKN